MTFLAGLRGDWMHAAAISLFQALHKAAYEGQTFAHVTLVENRAEYAAICRTFQKTLQLTFHCDLDRLPSSFRVDWKTDHPFFQPKPAIPSSPTQPLNMFKFNYHQPAGELYSHWVYKDEELILISHILANNARLEYEGNSVLTLGPYPFQVHSQVLRAFSPFLRQIVDRESCNEKYKVFGIAAPRVSKRAFEAFVTFVYLGHIDFSEFPFRTAIEFLEWGFYLESESLRQAAFHYIYDHVPELSPADTFHLHLVHKRHPEFAPAFFQWLKKHHPDLYDPFQEEPICLEEISMHWKGLSLAQKTIAMRQASQTNDRELLQELERLGKDSCDDAYFLQAYQMMQLKILQYELPFS